MPPAGWYEDPKLVNTRRYWDGENWTDHRQEKAPVAHASTARPSRVKDETAYVWAVALLPIALIVLYLTVPEVFSTNYIWFGYWAVAAVLCWLDAKQLRARGVWVEAIGGILLLPLYLISRTRRAGSTPGIPIVWFAAFGGSILAAYLAAGPYDFDEDQIETDVASQLDEQLDGSFSVDCPETGTVVGGDVVTCDYSDESGTTSGTLAITFDRKGSYSWQATG
jgi:hypothetical protein